MWTMGATDIQVNLWYKFSYSKMPVFCTTGVTGTRWLQCYIISHTMVCGYGFSNYIYSLHKTKKT